MTISPLGNQTLSSSKSPSFPPVSPASVPTFRRFSWSCYCSGSIGVDSANRLHHAVKLSRAIREDALEKALATLARHRDAVRARVEEIAGAPVLHFDRPPRFERTIAVHSDAVAALSAWAWRRFDLAEEGLFRAVLTEIDGELYMAFVMHHLVSDSGSFARLWLEFWRNYGCHVRGLEPPAPQALSYGGYLSSLEAWRRSAAGQAQTDEVAARLAPFAQARPVSTASSLARTPIRIVGDLLAAVRRVATQAKVTPFCILLAAQAGALIEADPGRPALIASVHSGRDHPALLDVIGYLADRSYYLIAPDDPPSPSALISATWRAIADVARHRFVRSDFVRDHFAARNCEIITPYFNFVAWPGRLKRDEPLHSRPPPSSLMEPLRLNASPIVGGPGPDTSHYGLSLVESPNAIEGEWTSKTPCDGRLAGRFIAHLGQLATSVRQD